MRAKVALALAALLAAAPMRAAAAERPAADRALAAGLVKNAWYWQARAREDKAEEAWNRVLAADPDNPEALAATGGFAARVGRMQQAKDALAHLERVNPGHPATPALRRQIELGARFGPLLAQARKLVHDNKPEEGAAKYRELFGGSPPPGDLALEYYQTIEGAKNGWDEARDGLQLLVRRAPEEPRFRLELAKVLTYRDGTRRDGIHMLEALSRDAAVAKDATAAWRRALLWLAPTNADQPLLAAYLKAHPQDAEVARLVDRARRSGTVKEGYAALDKGDLAAATRLFRAAGEDPEAKRGLGLVAQREASQARKQGFAALEKGDLGAAQRAFEQSGDDADARLGLALVAQREGVAALKGQDFARARDALERAKKLAPQRPDLWEAPLRSATFWQLMGDARAAREAGQDAAAEAKLVEAGDAAPPADRWHADAALADLYLARGDRAKAEARYRQVLAAAPDDPAALRALTGILVQEGRFDEALPLNERVARAAPQQAFRAGWLRAEAARARAAQAHARRDLTRTRKELEAARAGDPQNAWVLHDLANVMLEQGAVADARPVVTELLRVAPGMAEARLVEARLLAADGREAEALDVLSALPPTRDAGVNALRRTLEVKVRVPALLALAADGRRAAAADGLARVEAQVADAPDLAAAVAVAWSKLGERQRALTLMRSAMARAPEATRGARLELASTLIANGDDATAESLLTGLERDPALSVEERRWLADLRIATAVRVADRERERGDTRSAGAALDAVLRDYPGDARVLNALGRLLQSQGDAQRAHQVYRRVLAAAPDDRDALRGAVDTALALADVDEARALASLAERRHPEDPETHLLAGRVSRARGDDAGAMRSFETALARIDRPGPTSAGGAGAPADGVVAASQSSAAVPEAGLRRSAAALATGTQAAPLRAEIQREMEQVRDRHRPALGGVLEARARDGEPGLSRLLELRQGVETEIPVGVSGRATFRFAEVELDSSAPSTFAAPRIGTGGDIAETAPFRVNGTELHVGYEDEDVAADVGLTPLGFPVQSVVGGARLRHAFGPLELAVEGARRNVTDSVLSFAGVTDPATGRVFGGVVSDAGRGQITVTQGPVQVRAYGGYGRLLGFRVAENRRTEGGGAVDVTAYRGALGAIGAGVSVAAFGFDRNLRHFTWGHGGYFSPERFLHAGVPVHWRRDGRFRFEIVAEPAYHTYREASAPTFAVPLPDGTTAGPNVDPGGYAGQTSRGFAFDGRLVLGLALGNHFDTSLRVALQEAPEFREVQGMFVLRYIAGGVGR